MCASVILRPAVLADIDAIEALVATAFGGYVGRIGCKPKPMLTDYRIALKEHQLWLLEEGNLLVGMLELIPHPSYLLVATIAVSPRHQRAGLGGRLMALAETEARRQGLSEIGLYTNERLTENLTFYKHLSYRESHREPINGDTSLVHMVKHLAP